MMWDTHRIGEILTNGGLMSDDPVGTFRYQQPVPYGPTKAVDAEIERLTLALSDAMRERDDYKSALEHAESPPTTLLLALVVLLLIDVALNGEAGAAKQASLCDIVAQVKAMKLVT